ncbi:MAG: hypothetical protein OZ935_13815 [Pseudomonadota bacterium]|jgi:hypothetical protein|nr:hypothetical protein [Pseudomonadota bacterium]
MPERALPRLRAHARAPEFLRAAWPALLLMLIAALLRYFAVEPESIAHACQPDPWSGLCGARSALIHAFLGQGIGWAALLVAVVAAILRRRAVASLALALAGAGLVLYSAEPSAAALVLSVLVLARR